VRVLLVVPVPPHPQGAGAIPVLLDAELTGLGERHQVTLLTGLGDEPGEAEAVAALAERVELRVADRRRPPPGRARRRRQARLAASWARGGVPWRTVWFADPSFQRELDRLARERSFDVIAVEDSAMSGFRFPAGVPTVFTHHEVLRARPVDWHPGPPRAWARWAFGEIDWRRWARFQPRAWGAFDLVQVFSRRDADAIAAIAPGSAPRVRVNPFGIVLPPVADPTAEVADQLLFVGNFAHPPNRDAAVWLGREIMPAVRAAHDGARLRIVGTAPPPEVLALAGDGVEVVADAPSVLPHLQAAAVVLAPVRTGGGMRMKVLQAMAAGKAVVTTPRGAEGFTGFGEAPPLRVAESGAEIAAAAVALLGDAGERRRLAAAARAFCERHHSPAAWAQRLTAVYEEARALHGESR
jgi:glycosyltransferase involved in cell wall biosynthesis